MILQSERLRLVLNSAEGIRKQIEQLTAADRAQVSPIWLARMEAATESNPWTHGFTVMLSDGGTEIGHAAFKGPPTEAGVVEIAYRIAPEYRGQGYATEAADALTNFAFRSDGVRVVCAHTLPQNSASTRVLTKCGFRQLGEVFDPEDGNVCRWERTKVEHLAANSTIL